MMVSLAFVSKISISIALLATGYAQMCIRDPPHFDQVGIRPISLPRSYGGYNPFTTTSFDDRLGDTVGLNHEALIYGVESMRISCHSMVESIQMTYRLSNGTLYSTPRRGGTKYEQFTINLATNEFIEKVEGRTDGTSINQMTIHVRNPVTYRRRIYGPFGKNGQKIFSMEGYFVGFSGLYNEDHIVNVGSYLVTPVMQTAYFGGNGSYSNPGVIFDDHPDTLSSAPVAKLTKIHVYSDATVYAILAEYLLFDGRTVSGQYRGDKFRGHVSTITFDETEELTGVEGALSDDGNHIDRITFVTWKLGGKYGTIAKYGPYGNTNRTRLFATRGYRIIGLSGNVGDSQNGLSMYYVDRYP